MTIIPCNLRLHWRRASSVWFVYASRYTFDGEFTRFESIRDSFVSLDAAEAFYHAYWGIA